MTPEHSDLASLASSLRSGRTTSRAILEAAVARHDAADLGAYVYWAGDAALQAADHVDGLIGAGYDTGPLMGLPCSLKDLYGVPGMPIHAGTDTALDAGWQRAGPVAARLLAQLGIVTGKTHTVELAFGGLGLNAHWPVPRNPWGGGGRVPGGSSSGAGVSLLEGTAVLALGSDTAGSVRIPASVTGTVGLKITHGRWSQGGMVPLSPSFDTPGILCRTAADIAYAFSALDPAAEPVPSAGIGGVRIGVLGGVPADAVDSDIGKGVEAALGLLERHGARLATARLAHDEAALTLFRQGGLAAPELAAFLQATMPERIARLDATVKARVDAADSLSAVDYLRRKAGFALMSAQTAATGFESFDVLACATVAISPPLIAELNTPEAYAKANMAVLRNTALANLLGLCAITLPAGLDRNGMPIGLMLMAPPLHEARLIAVAAAAERILGTARQQFGATPL